MKRYLLLLPLLLLLLFGCRTTAPEAASQAELTIDDPALAAALNNLSDERNIVYDDQRRARQCPQQRPVAARFLSDFLTHPSIENAAFSDWTYTGYSRSIRDDFENRGVIFNDLFERLRLMERLGDSPTNSTCPDRSRIARSAILLARIATEFDRQFPDADAAPVSIVGYIEWKLSRD